MDSDREDAIFVVFFIAFVFAGVYKSAWYVEWFPVDLTLFFGILATGTAGWIVYNREIRITRPGVTICALFCAFAAYALVSGLWSPSVNYYWSKSIRLVGVTGLALGLAALFIAPSNRRLRYTGIATVGFAVLTAIETLYRYEQAVGNVELYPFGTNYLITGRVIGIGVIITVGYLVFSRQSRGLSIASASGAVLMGYALLVSGARGPMVALIGSIGILVVVGVAVGSLPNSRRALISYATVALVSAVGLVTLAQQLRGIRRMLALFEGPGSSLGQRFEYWSNTISAFRYDTIFFGEGFGSWPLLAHHSSDSQSYPHNIVLEVLFELGLVGAVLIVALFVYAVHNLYRDWVAYGRPVHIILSVLFIYMMINAMVTGDLNENRYLFVVIGVMAFSVTAQRYPIRAFVPSTRRTRSTSTRL